MQDTDRRGRGLALLSLLACLLTLPASFARAQGEEINIHVSGTLYVNAAGNARISATYSFDPPRAYDRLKKLYPNLYVLFRDFGVSRASFDINRSSLQIESDDGARTVTFRGDVLGAAVCRSENWYLAISRDERIVTRVENRIFTTSATRGPSNMLFSGKFEYRLPAAARIVEYAPDRQQLSYALPHRKLPGMPKLDVHLRHKKRLMAATYKIYADPEAADGAYWVAKLVVQNTGSVPIYDLRVTYRLGDYTDESVPQKYTMVAAKGAVVDTYYPVISSRVAQLRSRTPAELRVRYEYADASGKRYSDQLSERVEILGINQFEFSNLSDDDMTDSWFDKFNNAPLFAALVMKNDEAVRQFTGIVSDAAEGAAASQDPQDALKWLRAAYEQQLRNNIVYQTPASFLTTDGAPGQEIKFPRDVFRDRSGTCIDLAIVYASLAESVGLRSYLAVMPGHCFAIVQVPGGTMLPVENTGIGTTNRLTFDQAVEAGRKALAQAQNEGLLFLIDVGKELSEGRISNPELPPVPPDFLEKVGIRRRR